MKAALVPDAERAATSLARLLGLHRASPVPDASHIRAVITRRLLEELGVHCDETASLRDLKGFLLSSARGTEIVVSRYLSDEDRVEVYAHLVAHALLGPDLGGLQLASQLEYVPGHEPDHRSAQQAREEAVADAVARAIVEGRLEAAPRLVYCRDLGPGRGRLSLAVLRGLHVGSLALYRRSRSYQRLRSLGLVTALSTRVHSFLGSAA